MELKAEVAAKYDLAGKVFPGRHCFPGFGEISLDELTLEQADKLAARGFPWLKLKEVKAPAKQVKAAPEQIIIPPVVDPDNTEEQKSLS